MPLSMVNPGQIVQIVQITGGRGLVSNWLIWDFTPEL